MHGSNADAYQSVPCNRQDLHSRGEKHLDFMPYSGMDLHLGYVTHMPSTAAL